MKKKTVSIIFAILALVILVVLSIPRITVDKEEPPEEDAASCTEIFVSVETGDTESESINSDPIVTDANTKNDNNDPGTCDTDNEGRPSVNGSFEEPFEKPILDVTMEYKNEVIYDIKNEEDCLNSEIESNTSIPEYNPTIGGENPFTNNLETIIDDTPVEDYVGNGEDRPGEGIHF